MKEWGAQIHRYGERNIKPYGLMQDLVFIHGAEEHGRGHGGEGEHTSELVEEMAGIVDAVARRLLRLTSRRDGVPARLGRSGSSELVVRARGGEKADVRRKKKASSAPLFIGEAW